MNNQEFQALLLKYRSGECTVDEIAKIHLWYDRLNQESTLSLGAHEKQSLEDKMLRSIREEMYAPDIIDDAFVAQKWWNSYSVYSGVAAVLIVALGFIFFLSRPQALPDIKQEAIFVKALTGKLITYQNETTQPKRVILEDKSEVILSPGSRIIYPEKFAQDRRDVQLFGNAFFEVTKNPRKPFLVFSGKLVTKVLGTSFRIKTNERDQALEVEVVTGKVSVFENHSAFASSGDKGKNSNNGVVLTPNQRVTYFSESRHLMTGLVVKPVKLERAQIARPVLIFDNSQLVKIIEDLQKEYGIEIVFANDRLEKCTFTGDISGMPLYEKLDLICRSNRASYEVKGTRILINGEGCD